jgi:NADPH:quinone reductase-like Zn-dependent oxidoreductase
MIPAIDETTLEKQYIMKPLVVDRYRKKGALRFGDMPEPEHWDNDVLVEIHAAGVNPLDSKIRDGEFRLILPYRLPLILGNDGAGVVVRVVSAPISSSTTRRRISRRLSGYDVVLNSQGNDTLENSMNVLKAGGKLISISGPPDAEFAKDIGANWFLQQVMGLVSFGIRRKAKRHRVSYSFLS